MATRILRSIKGRVIRLTRLDVCGAPVVGPKSSIVTRGFISVTLSEEIEAGEEYTQKNAWGEFCINEKDPDIMKWVNTTVELCEVDPDVLDVIGGATPVIAGGNTIGWTRGAAAPVGAFAVEVWTKKTGADACAAPESRSITNKALVSNVATLTVGTNTFSIGQTVTIAGVGAPFDGTYVLTDRTSTLIRYAKTNADVTSASATGTASAAAVPEWGYFVVPFVKNGKLDGDWTIANAPLNISLVGEGYGAPADWGLGPYGDDPFVVTFPVGEMYGAVVTPVQPPDPTDGAVALA